MGIQSTITDESTLPSVRVFEGIRDQAIEARTFQVPLMDSSAFHLPPDDQAAKSQPPPPNSLQSLSW